MAASETAQLRALRSVVGNYALQRMVAARGAPARVLQRQVLTRLDVSTVDDVDWVWDVVVGGRTPSPFTGTMGAHSTAWVAHMDEVRRQVVNLPLGDAAANLRRHVHSRLAEELVDDEEEEEDHPRKSTLYDLVASLGEKHLKALTGARKVVRTGLDDLELLLKQTKPDGRVLVDAVRSLINAYLTYVNYLPGATVAGGDPRGHGEGAARGELTQFEYVCSLTLRQPQLVGGDTAIKTSELGRLELAAKKLPDWLKDGYAAGFEEKRFEGGAYDVLRRRIVDDLWAMFAPETPRIFLQSHTGLEAAAVWRPMLRNFLSTVRSAYPYAFDFTTMHLQAAQLEGLRRAAEEADEKLPGDIETILGTELVEEADVRDLTDYAAVSDSDLQRGGSGFQAMVLFGEGDTIGDVEMIGRTMSPFSGTMGAHTTAWAAHVDAVTRLLRGKSLSDAIAALLARARAGLMDFTLSYLHLVDEKQQHYIVGSHTALREVIADEPLATQGAALRRQYLERLIAEYMTYLNFLPLSTIQTGWVPGGRGEGRARRVLLAYEDLGDASLPYEPKVRVGLLREALGAMFDTKAIEHFGPPKDKRPLSPWPHGHLLESRLRVTGKERLDEREKAARLRYHATLMEAYPRSMKASGLAAEHGKQVLRLQEAEAEEERVLRGMLSDPTCLMSVLAVAQRETLRYHHLVEARIRVADVDEMTTVSKPAILTLCKVFGIPRVVVHAKGGAVAYGAPSDKTVEIRETMPTAFEVVKQRPLDPPPPLFTVGKDPKGGSRGMKGRQRTPTSKKGGSGDQSKRLGEKLTKNPGVKDKKRRKVPVTPVPVTTVTGHMDTSQDD